MGGKFSVTESGKKRSYTSRFPEPRNLVSNASLAVKRSCLRLARCIRTEAQDESSSFNEAYRERAPARRHHADRRAGSRGPTFHRAGHPDRGTQTHRAQHPVRLSAYQARQHLQRRRASEAIRALYATGLFNDVRISAEGTTVIVQVQERPAAGAIDFAGIHEFDKDNLTKES